MQKITCYTGILLGLMLLFGCNNPNIVDKKEQNKTDLQIAQSILQTITSNNYTLSNLLDDMDGYTFRPGFQIPDIDTVIECTKPGKGNAYLQFTRQPTAALVTSLGMPVTDTITMATLKKLFGNYHTSPLHREDPSFDFYYTNPLTKHKAVLFVWSSDILLLDNKKISPDTIPSNDNLRVNTLHIQSADENNK